MVIVHGYGGNPGKNWFPWLRAELEKLGVSVSVPQMPNADNPLLKEWLPHLQEVIGTPNEDTYLVGHSLGCPTILRYLESLGEGQKVGGVVLVSGFAEHIHLSELDNFTQDDWDTESIKKATNKILLINSDNDEHVPIEIAQRMRDQFGAELVVFSGAGHFNEKSGHLKVPEVLEKLKELMKIS